MKRERTWFEVSPQKGGWGLTCCAKAGFLWVAWFHTQREAIAEGVGYCRALKAEGNTAEMVIRKSKD